jgi:hypothetical protein
VLKRKQVDDIRQGDSQDLRNRWVSSRSGGELFLCLYAFIIRRRRAFTT